MNMEISGLGKISSGEYGNLSISGCGRLDGEIRCNSFSASGLAKGDSIECNGDFSISGNSKFNTIKADKIKLSKIGGIIMKTFNDLVIEAVEITKAQNLPRYEKNSLSHTCTFVRLCDIMLQGRPAL